MVQLSAQRQLSNFWYSWSYCITGDNPITLSYTWGWCEIKFLVFDSTPSIKGESNILAEWKPTFKGMTLELWKLKIALAKKTFIEAWFVLSNQLLNVSKTNQEDTCLPEYCLVQSRCPWRVFWRYSVFDTKFAGESGGGGGKQGGEDFVRQTSLPN
jgi:hypothetical protein